MLLLQCFIATSDDYQELNMAKSKVLVFKIAGNWGGFLLQTRYFIKKIVSVYCAHHIVHFTLVLDLWLGKSC